MPKRNRKPVGDPATKARLAKRAYDLFAQRGYFRVTVADIVRSGGVARGTFYIYWRSKQDCFEDLVDQLVDQLYAEATVRDPARDTRERIAVANRRYLEVFRAHAGILATLYQVATFNPRIGQRQAEVRRRFLARIQRHIERNVAEGLIDGLIDPAAAAVCLGLMVDWFAYLWAGRREFQELDLDKVVDTMTTIWYRALYCGNRGMVSPSAVSGSARQAKMDAKGLPEGTSS